MIDVKEVYEDALYRVKRYTGLKDLTNIEKFGLMIISREAVARLERTTHPKNRYSASGEAAAIFMLRYYDTPAASQGDVSFLMTTRMKRHMERGYDVISEYFQLEQDRRHTP